MRATGVVRFRPRDGGHAMAGLGPFREACLLYAITIIGGLRMRLAPFPGFKLAAAAGLLLAGCVVDEL